MCGNHLQEQLPLCQRTSSVVSHVEPNTLLQPAICAVQLGMVLRCLAESWNRIHPHLSATKTRLAKYVDTTLAPSDGVMWLRTALVLREGAGWEVDGYCEPIADWRRNLEEDFTFIFQRQFWK